MEPEELVEGQVELVEAPETPEAQAREAIRTQSPERAERWSSSARELSMGEAGEPCPPGGLQGQLREVSLVVGLVVGH